MEIERLAIPEVVVITPKRFGDARGFFSETYNRAALSTEGIELDFVQDNHSLSADPGTLRGLHFQTPPFAQDKLVRVVRGAILDVAVDIRTGSPSYGRHVSAVLSAENWAQILVPKGFAHGFCTLEPDCEVIYKVSAPYAPAHDKGMAWDDPALGIEWPVAPDKVVLSDKDRKHPRLADLPAYFAYETTGG
ncbi:MAG: dTDP-4-dehydrorhamnose 3,5-epimerase [Pseudomonadota bacterium]